jgi:Fe-S cluster biosynthesis and repair protein YggX
MAQQMIMCAKLGRELPALDPASPDGSQALRMALLLGGPELRQRIMDQISAEAWSLWKDRMIMVVNEYRLDPTSDSSNAILKEHLEDFLFGHGQQIRNYVPPKK